jgi:hypothetical protein
MLFSRFLGGLVSGASTLAFAGVLAFAAVVAGFTTALALALILSLAGMFSLLVICQSSDRGSGFALGARGEGLYCKRPAQQTGNGSAGDHRF